MSLRIGDSWQRLLPVMCAVAAILLLLPCALGAVALIGYPWDWSPDEGMFLDLARRFARAPASLYSAQVVPNPDFYGPVLPALLAPVVLASTAPLGAARSVAAVWTVLAWVAMYLLVRRRAPAAFSLIAATLALGAFEIVLFFFLVRPDGLMVACWLWAAVFVLPERLERDADSLSWRRAAAGALALTAAVFAKPTAVLVGAPLVLGWFLVDRRSALRLAGLVTAFAALVVVSMSLGTEGGHLRQVMFWSVHRTQPGLLQRTLGSFLRGAWPLVAFAAGGFAYAWRRGERPLREPALLLVAGGLMVLPTLAKRGAMVNYLLPLLCALAVLAGRSWTFRDVAADGTERRRAGRLASLGAIAVAMVCLQFRNFLVPPVGARETGRAFYGAVEALVGGGGRPLLALKPDYAYFVVDQPVEVDWTSFMFLLDARVPGSEAVLDRLQRRSYRTVVLMPYFLPPDHAVTEILRQEYKPLGICQLSYFYGMGAAVLMVPQDREVSFDPPPGTLCRRWRDTAGS